MLISEADKREIRKIADRINKKLSDNDIEAILTDPPSSSYEASFARMNGMGGLERKRRGWSTDILTERINKRAMANEANKGLLAKALDGLTMEQDLAFCQIMQWMTKEPGLRLFLTGVPNSGKSFLAERIKMYANAKHIRIDVYDNAESSTAQRIKNVFRTDDKTIFIGDLKKIGNWREKETKKLIEQVEKVITLEEPFVMASEITMNEDLIVSMIADAHKKGDLNAIQAIAKTNADCAMFNDEVRRKLGYKEEYAVGDKMIARYGLGHLILGETYYVTALNEQGSITEVVDLNKNSIWVDIPRLEVRKKLSNANGFTVVGQSRLNNTVAEIVFEPALVHAYCITVNMAQDQKYKKVFIYDPRKAMKSYGAEIYTAKGRATEEILLAT
jgi:hypothetical protein